MSRWKKWALWGVFAAWIVALVAQLVILLWSALNGHPLYCEQYSTTLVGKVPVQQCVRWGNGQP